MTDQCPRCGEMAELSDAPDGSMRFTEPLCADCRYELSQPQPCSQAERNGDA